MRETPRIAYRWSVLMPIGVDDPRDLPPLIRIGAAVVPVVFAIVGFIAHPVLWVAVAGIVTTSPWLLTAARVPLRPLFCTLVPLAGSAWLMAEWRHSDIVLMLLVYLVGQQGTLDRPAAAIATWLGALAIPIGWQIGDGYNRAPAWLIGMTFACVCGIAFRKQQETMRRLQLAQQELAEKAVTDERRRIAREVHDLVAHSLAVTMLHLTGARLALADGETAEAEAALASAEKLGRSSMAGIRQAVGLLAITSDTLSWGPEPDLGDLPALIEDYTLAGVAVTMTQDGEPVGLDPATGLTLFRLVQESLANAARHAPGQPVLVHLRWTTGEIELSVRNALTGTAAAAPTGHGLIGMRERAEQLGGRFMAGPHESTWMVEVALPIIDAAAAEAATQ